MNHSTLIKDLNRICVIKTDLGVGWGRIGIGSGRGAFKNDTDATQLDKTDLMKTRQKVLLHRENRKTCMCEIITRSRCASFNAMHILLSVIHVRVAEHVVVFVP